MESKIEVWSALNYAELLPLTAISHAAEHPSTALGTHIQLQPTHSFLSIVFLTSKQALQLCFECSQAPQSGTHHTSATVFTIQELQYSVVHFQLWSQL